MSFSITIFEKEITSQLSDTLREKIAEIPDEHSRKEAGSVADVIVDTLQTLIEGNGDFGSAYISGGVVTNQNAHLSINVTFQTVQQKRQAEEQAILRTKADSEREAAERARAEVKAQGPKTTEKAASTKQKA